MPPGRRQVGERTVVTIVLSPWTASQPVRPISPSLAGTTEGESPAPGSWHFPAGFSQADQLPIPSSAWLHACCLSQPQTVSVLCCCYLEQRTCVFTYCLLVSPATYSLPSNLLGLPTHLLSTYIYVSNYPSFYLSSCLYTYVSTNPFV